MTPRPTFTLRELRRMHDLLDYVVTSAKFNYRRLDRQVTRDAAAFARLRVKVQGMVEGREEKR